MTPHDETYVQLRRGFLEHVALMPPMQTKAFVFFLLAANRKSHSVFMPLYEMCNAIGCSKSSLLKALTSLEAGGYIEYKPAANQWGVSSVKVLNYERNVRRDEEEVPPVCWSRAGNGAGNGTGSETLLAHRVSPAETPLKKQETRNKKQEGEIWEEFITKFWPEYPKKQGRSDAFKAYVKARELIDWPSLLLYLKSHKDYWKAEGTAIKFIPHASSWLNQKRWEDELPQKTSAPDTSWMDDPHVKWG